MFVNRFGRILLTCGGRFDQPVAEGDIRLRSQATKPDGAGGPRFLGQRKSRIRQDEFIPWMTWLFLAFL